MYNLVLTNRDYKREKRAERGGARVGRMGGGGGGAARERERVRMPNADRQGHEQYLEVLLSPWRALRRLLQNAPLSRAVCAVTTAAAGPTPPGESWETARL